MPKFFKGCKPPRIADRMAAVFGALAVSAGLAYGAQIAASVVAPQTMLLNPVVSGHLQPALGQDAGIATPVITGSACSGALSGVVPTDLAGAVVPSGSGTCIVTFAKAFNQIPVCVGINSSATTALPLLSASKTALTITSAAAATSVQYICVGN